MRDAGGTVIGLDWRTPLGEAWAKLGYEYAVQGNMDSTVLFAHRAVAEKHAQHVLDEAGGRPGHIFNLGHGITPDIDPAHLGVLIDEVHEHSRRMHG